MFTIKRHMAEIVWDDGGWNVVCDGVALWKGLSREGAENIITYLRGEKV